MQESHQVIFTKQAMKDRHLIAQAGLEKRVKALLNLLMKNPYQSPPPYEKPVSDLSGFYSRRINLQHRLVYSVDKDDKDIKIVKVLRMWTHYE